MSWRTCLHVASFVFLIPSSCKAAIAINSSPINMHMSPLYVLHYSALPWLLEPSHDLRQLVSSYRGNLSKHMLSWTLTEILVWWKFLSRLSPHDCNFHVLEQRSLGTRLARSNTVWQVLHISEVNKPVLCFPSPNQAMTKHLEKKFSFACCCDLTI